MAVETRISNEAYERLALAEPDVKWELWDGVLRAKPPMTDPHNWLAVKLGHFLLSQLDWSEFHVRINSGRVRRPASTYYVPDLFVLPTIFRAPPHLRAELLETYDLPLPLIVEVWSRSTGGYDFREELEVYKQRGDLDIWFFHPNEHTLSRWIRMPDGSYEQSIHRDGIVRPAALPGVEIDLAKLFEL